MSATLQFNERTHEYFLDYEGLHREPIPHVTGILQAMGLYVVPLNAREFHRDRGKAIHLGCTYVNAGVYDPETTDERVRGYIASYQIFAEEAGFAGELAEESVYSALYRYAGTFDLYGVAAHFGFERWLVELKSGNIAPAHHLQSALYAQALKEMYGKECDKRVVVSLADDGSRPHVREGNREDLARALEAVNLYHWRRRFKLLPDGREKE